MRDFFKYKKVGGTKTLVYFYIAVIILVLCTLASAKQSNPIDVSNNPVYTKSKVGDLLCRVELKKISVNAKNFSD